MMVEQVKEKESKVVKGGAVCNDGIVKKAKWQYVKHNMTYWEGQGAVSLNRKGK